MNIWFVSAVDGRSRPCDSRVVLYSDTNLCARTAVSTLVLFDVLFVESPLAFEAIDGSRPRSSGVRDCNPVQDPRTQLRLLLPLRSGPSIQQRFWPSPNTTSVP